jgi:hypothetical protein
MVQHRKQEKVVSGLWLSEQSKTLRTTVGFPCRTQPNPGLACDRGSLRPIGPGPACAQLGFKAGRVVVVGVHHVGKSQLLEAAKHEVSLAASLARAKTGKRIAARMAIIAMTTDS